MTNRKFEKLIKIFSIAIITLLFLSTYVYADAGPKPSLTIVVKGLDTDKYWLDLLVAEQAKLSWLEISETEREQVSRLAEYQDTEGYHPALLVGTQVPLIGSLRGKNGYDGSFVHNFSYVGVPRTFKIAILTEDGRLIVSEVVNRKQFSSIMHYDLAKGDITGEFVEPAGKVLEGMSWTDFVIGLLGSTILTLIIELTIARMAGFKLQKSYKVMFNTNCITQIILNLVIFFFNNSLGQFGVVMGLVLGEIIVVITEAKVYMKFLDEKSKTQRMQYALVVNILSILIGFFIFFI